MEENKHDEELEFIEGLYNEAEEEIKEVYKEQKKNRDNLLQELALIMLAYTVLDGLMSLTSKDKKKEYNRLSNIIKTNYRETKEMQNGVITDILTKTVNNTFNFYSYNAGLKDVQAIIDKNFKGKHFSDRVWENEKDTAKHLHKQVNDFLNGKVNVNQIKRDIERTYNTSAYNAKRLVTTEVSRCSSNAFDRFCKEVGVKKVRYNATLDSKLCDDCGQYHNKVFNLNEKIDVPRHPLCRCFYTIEDDQGVLDKTDYMANRFVPDFGKVREFELKILSRNEKGEPELKLILTNEKRVSNSNFDMWTDMESTSRNKAVRLYEKKLNNIKDELPDWFEMPRISIIDFEKNDIDPKAIGGYNREVNTMFINSKYDTDAKILKYLKSQEGYFANTESNSLLIHELGHKYHHDLADKIAKKYDIGYNEAKERFDKSIEDYIRNKDHIISRYINNNISGYAADEFEKNKIFNSNKRMNELMAEYFTIKDNDNELIKFINSKIKEMTKNDG